MDDESDNATHEPGAGRPSRLCEYLKQLKMSLRERGSTAAARYEKSVKPQVGRAVDATTKTAKGLKNKYDESSVKPRVDKVVGAAGDTLDTVSGKKILELVEARLELQARYNDILATKLDEALRRIETLEDVTTREKRGA